MLCVHTFIYIELEEPVARHLSNRALLSWTCSHQSPKFQQTDRQQETICWISTHTLSSTSAHTRRHQTASAERILSSAPLRIPGIIPLGAKTPFETQPLLMKAKAKPPVTEVATYSAPLTLPPPRLPLSNMKTVSFCRMLGSLKGPSHLAHSPNLGSSCVLATEERRQKQQQQKGQARPQQLGKMFSGAQRPFIGARE